MLVSLVRVLLRSVHRCVCSSRLLGLCAADPKAQHAVCSGSDRGGGLEVAGRSHAADIRAGKHNNLSGHPSIPLCLTCLAGPLPSWADLSR